MSGYERTDTSSTSILGLLTDYIYADVARLYRWNWATKKYEALSDAQLSNQSWGLQQTIILTHGWNDKLALESTVAAPEYMIDFAKSFEAGHPSEQDKYNYNILAVDWYEDGSPLGSAPVLGPLPGDITNGEPFGPVVGELLEGLVGAVAGAAVGVPVALPLSDANASAFNAIEAAKPLARKLAVAGIVPQNLTLIGHSNGAAFMGSLAEELWRLKSSKVETLIALDAPWLTRAYNEVRSAARVVDDVYNYYVPLVAAGGIEDLQCNLTGGAGASMTDVSNAVNIQLSEPFLSNAHSKVPLRFALTAHDAVVSGDGKHWGFTLPTDQALPGHVWRELPTTPISFESTATTDTPLQVFGRVFVELEQCGGDLFIEGSAGLVDIAAAKAEAFGDKAVQIWHELVTTTETVLTNTARSFHASVLRATDKLGSLWDTIRGKENSPVAASIDVQIPNDAATVSFDLSVLNPGNNRTLLVGIGHDVIAEVDLTEQQAIGGDRIQLWVAPYAGRYTTLTFYMPSDEPSNAEFIISNLEFGSMPLPQVAGQIRRQDFDTGLYPTAIAAGDFNEDGHTDLAVGTEQAAPGETALGILYGDGFGSFSSPVWIPSRKITRSVTSIDLNGDGHLDLVSTHGDTKEVEINLGDGHGNFIQSSYFIGGDPRAVVINDFDRNGTLDLAVADRGTHKVWILAGDGLGTFSAAVGYDGGASPTSAAAGDFNNDQIPDLVVGNQGSGMSLLLGDGSGGFLTPISLPGAATLGVAVGDFDGDGNADIVQTSAVGNAGFVRILLGDGQGLFPRQTTFAHGPFPQNPVTTDFDGDGRLDVVLVDSHNNTVSILPGDGAGGVKDPIVYGTATQPYAVAIADVDEDQRLDVAVANLSNSSVSIFNATRPGLFSAPLKAAKQLTLPSTDYGDFNRDGLVDRATVNSGSVAIALGRPDGTFDAEMNYAAGPQPQAVLAADFDGDHIVDLAVSNRDTGTVSILIGNGLGGFSAPTAYSVGRSYPGGMSASDFDGDGNLDLAVAVAALPGSVAILHGNGRGQFGPPTHFDVPFAITDVAAGDLNGDGRPDLALVNSGRQSISLLLSNSSQGGYQAPIHLGVGAAAPKAVEIDDYNGDGKVDLIVLDASETVWLLVNNNDPPIVDVIPNQTIDEGDLLTFKVTASDPNGNRLEFSIAPGSPAGVTIDPKTGVFRWTPSEAQGSGTHNVTVRVADNGIPSREVFETFTVAVNEVNRPPSFAPIADQLTSLGRPLSFSIVANDPDLPVNSLTYSLNADAPQGASIDATTGVFSWTPTAGQGPGMYSLTVQVNDNGTPNLSDSRSFIVAVTGPATTFQVPIPFNQNTVFPSRQDTTLVDSPNAVAAADFNGDGKLDLAVGFNGKISLLIGSGTGTFQLGSSDTGPTVVELYFARPKVRCLTATPSACAPTPMALGLNNQTSHFRPCEV